MKENEKIDAEIVNSADEFEMIASDEKLSEAGFELPTEIAEGAVEKDRDEYERLIKTRFKEYYAEDTQKMINRRFRKYKVLEEKCRVLEELVAEKDAKIAKNDQTVAAFEERLQQEVARVAEETRQSVLESIKNKKMEFFMNTINIIITDCRCQ